MNIIVGTAGHIDHGKTSLVLALTGVDADRLPEEKSRGITIDLGFAELKGENETIGFVDVPGHERFVKNMLAGASGIDAVVLVVAADEGVMPQTREHFEICRLLRTKRGLIVLTKKDLVEPEFLSLVESDVAELVANSFLEEAPVIPVSAKTGEGVDAVKEALFNLAASVASRGEGDSTRLPVDRAFSIKGFGAVVTGTLAAGKIGVGDEMELWPAGRTVRVRGVQSHGSSIECAAAGQRTAVNLGGIDHNEIERGMVLAEKGALGTTQILDCLVEVLKDASGPLKSKQRVRVHLGTVEALARIDVLNAERELQPGETDFVQIRLEKPAVSVPGERFIIRQYSPQMTIAGGSVLDARARKRKRDELAAVRARLQSLADSDFTESERLVLFAEPFGLHGCDIGLLRALTGKNDEALKKSIETATASGGLISAEGIFVAKTHFDGLRDAISRMVEDFHAREPLSRGLARETLREKTASGVPGEVFREALASLENSGKLRASGDVVALTSHLSELSPEEEKVSSALVKIYKETGLLVPTLKDALESSVSMTNITTGHARKLFQLLVDSKKMVKVSEDLYFTSEAIGGLIESIRKFAGTKSENRLIGVPEFKEMAGVSRKYAIPLLEYLDGEGVTRRAGDKRIVL